MLSAVEGFLGGALDPVAVPAFVPRRAGGDLVVLQESVREARVAGVLVERDGVWRLARPMPPSEGMRSVLYSRLTRLTAVTAVVASALDVLALAPDLGQHALRLLMQELDVDARLDQSLERLEDDGVIDVLDGVGGLRLRLRDPVIELVLAQNLGRLRRLRLVRALYDVLERLPRDELRSGELVALARSALELDRPADGATLNQAARAALQAARAEPALHLALAAVAHDGGAEAQLTAATAEAQLDRHADALERLGRLTASAGIDARQRETAVELTRLVRRRMQDPAFGWNGPSRATAGGIDIPLTSMLQFGLPGDGRSSSSDQAAAADDVPIAILEGEKLAQEAGHAAMTGELTRMHELLDAGEAILGPVGADMFRLHLSRAIANCFDGQIDQSLDLVLRYRASAAALGQPVQQSSSGWFAGGLLLAAGRALEAVPVLRECMGLMEAHGLEQGAGFARADLAIALATIGDIPAAEAMLEALDGFPPGFLIEGRRLQARGWIAASEGRFGESAAAFVRAADAHEALGHRLQALLALVESARAGGALSVATRIDRLAERVEGKSLAVSARFARALAISQADAASSGSTAARSAPLAREFDEIGEAANQAGMHMLAAEAFDRASSVHASVGADRDAAAAGRHSAEQVAICGFTALPFLGRRATVELSDREREVAVLASGGMSNRAIAEALVLSVRTVETHLLRVYRKLGIRHRSELEGALATRR